MRLFSLLLLALPAFAVDNVCTLLKTAGLPCADNACSWSDIVADTGHANWSGTGCTANGYVPDRDRILIPNGVTFTIDADPTLANYETESSSSPAIGCTDIYGGTGKWVVAAGHKVIVRNAVATCQGQSGVGAEIYGTLAVDSTGTSGTPNLHIYSGTNGTTVGAFKVMSGGTVRAATAAETGTVKSPNWNTYASSTLPQLICDGGTLQDMGTATTAAVDLQIRDGKFHMLNGCVMQDSGIVKAQVSAAAQVRCENSKFIRPIATNNVTNGGTGFYFFGSTAIGSGVRSLQHCYVDGTIILPAPGFTINGLMTTFDPNRISAVTGGIPGGFINNGAAGVVASASDLFAYMPTLNLLAGFRLPSGTVSYVTSLFGGGASNMHGYETTISGNTTFDSHLYEAISPDVDGDAYQVVTQTSAGAWTFQKLLSLAPWDEITVSSSPQAPPAFVNLSANSVTNINVAVTRNTYMSRNGAALGVMGVGMEGAFSTGQPISTVNSNLAFWPGTASKVYVYRQGTKSWDPNMVAEADYNGVWNSDGTNPYDPDGQPNLFAATPGTHDVSGNPYFVEHRRRYIFAPTDLLGLTATAWTAGTSGAHQSYAVGDVVAHGYANYLGGKTILWRCIQAHDAYSVTDAEPGHLGATNLATFLGYWEPYVVELLRTATVAGTLYYDDATGCSSGCSLNKHITGWVRRAFTPQNRVFCGAGKAGVDIGAVDCTTPLAIAPAGF